MQTMPNRRDYKTGKEYRFAKRTVRKERSAEIRPFVLIAAVIGVPLWLITGSFLAFILALFILTPAMMVLAKRKRPIVDRSARQARKANAAWEKKQQG